MKDFIQFLIIQHGKDHKSLGTMSEEKANQESIASRFNEIVGGFFTCVAFEIPGGGEYLCWVNDDGIRLGLSFNLGASNLYNISPLYGDAVISGIADNDREITSLSAAAIEAIRFNAEFSKIWWNPKSEKKNPK